MHSIKRVKIINSNTYDTCANLAYEEYLMNSVDDDELIIFWWQSDAAVVVGRNQNVYQECNIDKLKEDGIRLVRRLSGGGAVFHDLGNINFAFVSKGENFNIDLHFKIILQGLWKLGIEGTFSGRNDLTVEGRKFSGNAFIHEENNHLHHGTLLVSSDLNKINTYLTVDHAKLDTKGFDSVKSRVINLNEVLEDVTFNQITDAVTSTVKELIGCDVEVAQMNSSMNSEIKAYLDKYYSDYWVYGNTPSFSNKIKSRFDWGSIELNINVHDGRIEDVWIVTDALDVLPFKRVETLLREKVLLPEVIYNQLSNCGFKEEQRIDVYNLISDCFFR